jgi:hypothetical protein
MRQMAVIRNVHVGGGDRGIPCLWFDTYISESSGALQVIDWETAGELLRKGNVYDVKELNGKPCWVEHDDNIIRFLELWTK